MTELARLKLAEMIRVSLAAKGLGEDLFDTEALRCLIAGEAHTRAAMEASKVVEALGIPPQAFAEVFREAYPVPDFKPNFDTGSPGFLGFSFVAPDGVDPMLLMDALVKCQLPTKIMSVSALPYLCLTGYRNAEKRWRFWPSGCYGTDRMYHPTELEERPDVDDPYWIGRHNSVLTLCTPDRAWKYGTWPPKSKVA